MRRIETAKLLAIGAHAWQSYWGYDYIYHLEQVANIAISLDMDEDIIVACYLHDTLEDTELRESEIAEMFWSEVLDMVERVTNVKWYWKNDNILTFVKISGSSKAVAVKLCDRICNLRFSRKNCKRRTLKYILEDQDFTKILSRWEPRREPKIWNKLWEMYHDEIEKSKAHLIK